MEFTSIKGFKDILPDEAGKWRLLEGAAREIFRLYGFREIMMPLMERTELFSRGIGLETDIVSKEMYTLLDSRGRGMTLRPEATASMIRAYVQHRLYLDRPVQKLFTIGPMFRHERPQKGRFRQFHQVDVEIIGDPGPRSDAELIVLAMGLLERLDLSDLTLHLNSLGCPDCRVRFRTALRAYLAGLDGLCANCRRRAETNPLRVFDCKVPACGELIAGAPSVLDDICAPCATHFERVQQDVRGAGYPYVINHRLVRGLDYYNRTTFEIQTEKLGAQNAVLGGGRYDGLCKLIGGPDHPAIGFALGMERVIALLAEPEGGPEKPFLYIAALGAAARERAFPWALALRKGGCPVELEYGETGLKAQMKRADRLGSAKVLIVGDDELRAGRAFLRDMQTKDQQELPLEDLVQEILSGREGKQ